jgi:hypothetical protein
MTLNPSRGALTLSNSERGHFVDDRRERIRAEPGVVGRRLTGCSRLLLLLFLLPGCVRAGSDAAGSAPPLHPGVWRGDVAPSGSAPFGALFHVGESDAGLTIRLESQFVRQAFTDIEAAPDSLRFTWPMETRRHCLLQRRDGHGCGATCHGDGTDPIALLMVPPARHEVMHVAATVAWGIPAAPWEWINEGLATYAPGECAGAGIHSLASALVESGSADPLHRLIDEFRRLDEVNAYLQSASVVGYIREVFGIEALRSIWQDGPAVLPVVTGMDLDDLERVWRAFVAQSPAASRALETVHTRGCL